MPLSERKAMVIPLPSRNGGGEERAFLPAALEILETPPSPIGRAIGISVLAITLAALAWSWFGRVDIIATAPGRIVPVGKTKIIQPFETGVVRAIHVADGDHVRTGDTLIELDPTQNGADRDRYRRDLRSARLDVARLTGLRRAITAETAPDLVDPPDDASALDLDKARATMQAQLAEEQAKLGSIDQQIASKASEARETEATTAKIEASLPVIQAQVDIRHELMAGGYGNKLTYLQEQQELIEQSQELPILASHRQGALADKLALVQQRAQIKAEFEKTTLDDLSKAEDQVSAIEAEFAKADERLSLTSLKAPIDGTIQQLAIHTIGGVVTPAEPLLVVVPDEGGLVAEVQVDNKDVGFVHEGQQAQVKVETFTFTRYGLIEGGVIGLSHDVVGDVAKPQEKPETTHSGQIEEPDPPKPSYVARIALARDWMKTENGRVALGPGMAVTAEIQTGRRRIIDYLLSPIVRRVSESGHER